MAVITGCHKWLLHSGCFLMLSNTVEEHNSMPKAQRARRADKREGNRAGVAQHATRRCQVATAVDALIWTARQGCLLSGVKRGHAVCGRAGPDPLAVGPPPLPIAARPATPLPLPHSRRAAIHMHRSATFASLLLPSSTHSCSS